MLYAIDGMCLISIFQSAFACFEKNERCLGNAHYKVKVGMVGLEPTRLAAHDSKSCASANSATSPQSCNYTVGFFFAKIEFC